MRLRRNDPCDPSVLQSKLCSGVAPFMSNPSATTMDVTISFTSQLRGKKLILYRGVGYSDTPTDTDLLEDGNPDTDTITFPDSGIVPASAID
jgi:hypothetical protein